MAGVAQLLGLIVVILVVSAASILVGLRFHRDGSISRTWTFVALAPSFLSLVLFWSLALHMRHALGGWPSGIGFDGFQGPLQLHARIAFGFFWHLFEYGFYLWPVICILFAVVSSLRKSLIYAGTYSTGLAVAMIVMLTAPSGFQRWWWD